MARRSNSEDVLGLAELAEIAGGELHGSGEVRVTSVAELGRAGAGDLVFVVDKKRLTALAGCDAAVALVPKQFAAAAHVEYELPTIGVEDPYTAVAAVLERLNPLVAGGEGVHDDACVAATAVLGDGVVVAAGAVIDEGARVGARTEIGAGSYVGPEVIIGADCLLYQNVTLYQGTRIGARVLLHAGVVIGADGFGFTRDAERQLKIPQVGGVRLGDDVEIGANSCVDRGTLSETVIGSGTKIDNLVQIGHNCRIGRNCTICALCGLSGSTVLEDGVIMGGQVGMAGHQLIGVGTMIAAKTGVHGDLPAGSMVAGTPHMDIRIWRRVVGALTRLPELLRRVRRIERRLDESPEE